MQALSMILLAAGFVGALAGPSAADTPPELADLAGVKGRDGESELLSRGYTFIMAQKPRTAKSRSGGIPPPNLALKS